MKRKRAQTPKPTANSGAASPLPTFLEHVYELRRRLFWVVAVILAASAAAYPFLDAILSVLTAPLAGQQLYYLTPIGGFSFSIKICFYVGIAVAVPFIMYHLYRFIEPLMGQTLRRSAFFYVGLSSLMAAFGILFAYFVSLPGALHFLTSMDLKNIQAMLTVDSYLTFVMTYLLGAALLFQIPLLLSITNNMTPLQPKKLMKAQRFVVVGAFVLAAIISPTPDVMNQLLLALPVVVMYQIGVLMVWLQNRRRAARAQREQTALLQTEPVSLTRSLHEPLHVAQQAIDNPPVVAKVPLATQQVAVTPRPVPHRRSTDGFTPASTRATSQALPLTKPAYPARRPLAAQAAQTVRPLPPRSIRVPARSIDGFMLPRAPHVASSS